MLPTTWLFDPVSFTPASKNIGDKYYCIITDHLGTPLSMYDEKGVQSWAAELDIYGTVKNLQGKKSDCPFRYPGQYEDCETGLYYNRFRYYDSESGKYVSQDFLKPLSSIRVYQYVNDANRLTDVNGLYSDLLESGMGHHVFPRSVATKLGIDELMHTNSIAWYPNVAENTADLHKQLHRAVIDEGIPFHGSKYTGNIDDAFAKLKDAYKGFTQKGFLKIPGTDDALFRNLTPLEAIEKLEKMHKSGELKKYSCS